MRPQATVIAQAPATVANVAVGFDVLGFAFGAAMDRVAVTRVDPASADGPVTVDVAGSSVDRAVCGDLDKADLPVDPTRNTASAALLAMTEELGSEFAFRVALHKGIPVSAGMGGSAASAVAAVVAANGLLETSLPKERLFDYALAGEAAASGARHADNVAPCLFGGLCVSLPDQGSVPRVVPIPVPPALCCVVVRPHLQVSTRSARAVLAADVDLGSFAAQSAHLAAFLASCFSGDLELMGAAMQDLVIGPQRQTAISGFAEVRSAALSAGAIGCAIAGSGPSVFAWTASADAAEKVRDAMVAGFAGQGLEADAFVGPVAGAGATVVTGVGQA